jgi:hypothetical protein
MQNQQNAVLQLQKHGFQITYEFMAEFPPFEELMICMSKKVKSTKFNALIDSEGLVNGIPVHEYIYNNTKKNIF